MIYQLHNARQDRSIEPGANIELGLGDSGILRQFATRENKAVDIYMIVTGAKRVTMDATVEAEIKKALTLTLRGAKDVFIIITHPDVSSSI